MSYTELHSDFAPSRARGRECYSRTDFPSHENLSISYSVTRRPSLPGIIGSVTWGCQLTSAARSERFRSAPRVHGFVPGLDRPVTCHQVCPLIRCRPSEQRLKSEMLGGKMPAIFRVSAWPAILVISLSPFSSPEQICRALRDPLSLCLVYLG